MIPQELQLQHRSPYFVVLQLCYIHVISKVGILVNAAKNEIYLYQYVFLFKLVSKLKVMNTILHIHRVLQIPVQCHLMLLCFVYIYH